MKKLVTLLFISLAIGLSSFGQYFQGSFNNIGNKLSFKMKPTGNITTAITYIEIAFRYNTATTPPFTIDNITPNTANFPGLAIARLPDYVNGQYTYVKFVHNTATIPSKTYMTSDEPELFTLTLGGNPSTVTTDFDMASDVSAPDNFIFGVADGAGNPLDPGNGDQLFGAGFFKDGSSQFVPLSNVPLPVKFKDFSVAKLNDKALLTWLVEDESSTTDKYEVLRSTNGVDFKSVKTIPALNNGRTSNSYSFTQEDLSGIIKSGVIYFRIKQIDKDGKFAITEIKNIRLNLKGMIAGVYPNPIKQTANVKFDLEKDEMVILSVTDALGKQLQVKQVQGFKGANLKPLDMSKLANGSYLLKVQAGDDTKILPIVKGIN